MKYVYIIFFLFIFSSCSSSQIDCPDGEFSHKSGNCVNPCDNVNCGEGQCKALSAIKYRCLEPKCISPKVLDKDSNTCIEPCKDVDCGEGECQLISESKYICSKADCTGDTFVDDNNNCINPCENINCGNNLKCQAKDAYNYNCTKKCDKTQGYYEIDGKCVKPCKNIDCGDGVTSCSYDEFNSSIACNCDENHTLLNGMCRIPFKEIDWKDESFENFEPEGFKDHKSKYDHTPHHNGYDLFFDEDEAQYIEGNFEYGDFRVNLEKEDVSIFHYSEADKSWKLLDTVEVCSDDEDEYPSGHFCNHSQRGGMFHYDIPEDKKLKVGLHLIKLLVRGDGSRTNMSIRVIPKEKKIKLVVFDMDGTLTTSDSEISKAFLAELWNGDSNAMKMYIGAQDTATYYYQRGYEILYLTARPYWLSEKSYNWLKMNNFPMGMMHTYEGAMPDAGFDAESFKKSYLSSLLEKNIDIKFAYGNALTDIKAYKHINLPCYKIFIIGKHAGKDCSSAVSTYPDHLSDLPK